MKHLVLLSIALLSLSQSLCAQNVGIGTTSPDNSAMLDISGTNKGLLIPRMSSANRQNIVNPAKGLMVYDTTNKAFYYFMGSGWLELLAGSVDKVVDADGDTKIQVEESADEDVIRIDLGGAERFIFDGPHIYVKGTGSTSTFLGNDAGLNDDLTENNNTFIGRNAGRDNVSGESNVAVGRDALAQGTSSFNTAAGWSAMHAATTANNSTALGSFALRDNVDGANNTALGVQSLIGNINGNTNTAVGSRAGHSTQGSGNVFLGYRAGEGEAGSNKLFIDNFNTSTPLIYGEFNNNLLRVNGTFNINNAFSFPLVDGMSGQVMQTNGSGVLSWVNKTTDTDDQVIDVLSMNGDTLHISLQDDGMPTHKMDLSGINKVQPVINDSDGDTRIHVEESTDEDIIRVDIAATEVLKISKNADGFTLMETPGSGGNSTLFGDRTGESLQSGSQYNTFFGKSAGQSLTTGSNNTFIGNSAGGNTSGAESNNTYIGMQSGLNAGGSGNVFLGAFTGQGEQGSNKLFIDNSNTLSPLIYGEFDNDWLKINGRLTSSQGITDSDGDTKIQVEETMDEDTIRFDLGGVESFVFGASRINIKSTTSSLYLGDNAGSANTTGNQNTLVGYHSGRQLTSGGFNVAVGSGAMPLNTIGGANVAVGATALSASLDGIRNTAVGYQALRASSSGDENTALGFRAGDANNGSFNIFLGNKAGFNELGSHKLYIESTDADSNNALIFGNFATDWLKINGHLSAKNGFADTDKDTKIQVEEGTDDDLIRFDVAGSQMLTIGKNGNGDLTMSAPGNSLFIGNGAGTDNAAINNIGIGWFSGHALTSGQGNVMLGSGAGQQISSGAYNTVIGSSTGTAVIASGSGNTIIGAGAGTGIPMSPLANNNTFIGADAGSGAGGSGNVFIGASAGAGTSFSDRLFIDNTNTSEPLIFGNFDTRTIRIYGGNEGTTYYPLVVHNEEDPFDERANGIQVRAGQNTNSQNSRFLACVTPDGDEIGSIRQNGNNTVNFAESSDRRLKTNIQPTSYTLEDVLRIRVSDYSFNTELNITRTGFIAQELYEIFPGAVSVGGEDPKIDPWAVDYGKLTPLLVKAIQDQQKEIENLKAEVAKLQYSNSNNQEAKGEAKAKAKAKEEALAKNG